MPSTGNIKMVQKGIILHLKKKISVNSDVSCIMYIYLFLHFLIITYKFYWCLIPTTSKAGDARSIKLSINTKSPYLCIISSLNTMTLTQYRWLINKKLNPPINWNTGPLWNIKQMILQQFYENKFKQWQSSIPPISRNEQSPLVLLNSKNIKSQ